jgi:uncharacterized membrane protein
VIRELPHPGLFENYRICPKCSDRFTVDADTKIRQMLLIPVGLASLVFTLFLYFDSLVWLVPSIASYLSLGLLIYWGNKKVFLVPCVRDTRPADDA